MLNYWKAIDFNGIQIFCVETAESASDSIHVFEELEQTDKSLLNKKFFGGFHDDFWLSQSMTFNYLLI